jgi:hypothetical protein
LAAQADNDVDALRFMPCENPDAELRTRKHVRSRLDPCGIRGGAAALELDISGRAVRRTRQGQPSRRFNYDFRPQPRYRGHHDNRGGRVVTSQGTSPWVALGVALIPLRADQLSIHGGRRNRSEIQSIMLRVFPAVKRTEGRMIWIAPSPSTVQSVRIDTSCPPARSDAASQSEHITMPAPDIAVQGRVVELMLGRRQMEGGEPFEKAIG